MSTWAPNAQAQEDPVITETDNTFVKKLRRNSPRPKFFEFKYEGVEDFGVTAQSDETGRSSSNVDLNKRVSFKLRAPILLKPKFSLLTGISFKKESFEFENTIPENSPFFNEFNRRSLSKVGLSFILKKNITDDKFYYAFLSGSLNSDDISFSDFTDKLKTSIVFIYVKNITAITQIGYGGGFGYIFGGPSYFPVFIYNSTFSARWNIEMMLPKSIALRFTPKPETYLLLMTDVTGASYFIKNQPIEGYEKLTFQRSTLEAKVIFEREIYDFIWFGVSAGLNIPLNLYLSEPGASRKDGLVVLDGEISPILSFSIFLVVPKKIHYKNAKGR